LYDPLKRPAKKGLQCVKNTPSPAFFFVFFYQFCADLLPAARFIYNVPRSAKKAGFLANFSVNSSSLLMFSKIFYSMIIGGAINIV